MDIPQTPADRTLATTPKYKWTQMVARKTSMKGIEFRRLTFFAQLKIMVQSGSLWYKKTSSGYIPGERGYRS